MATCIIMLISLWVKQINDDFLRIFFSCFHIALVFATPSEVKIGCVEPKVEKENTIIVCLINLTL